MNLSLIYGTVIGLLIGLAYCYWKQIKVAKENAGVLGAADSLYGAASNFVSQFRQKF